MFGYLLALASLLLPLSSNGGAPSIEVTPDGTATMAADTNATAFATFKLRNTGNKKAAFALTCSGTGTASGCAVTVSSLTIAAGESAFVLVSYHSGGEGVGMVSLTASSGSSFDGGTYITRSQPGTARAPAWISNQSGQGQASITAGGGGGGQASTPYVYISAPAFSSTADVFVSIMWCDNGNALNPSSRQIKLNLVNVTSNFDYNNIGMDCLVSTAESQGTITLSPGDNLISASISNTWPKSGSEKHEISYVLPGVASLDISMNPNDGIDRSECVISSAGPGGAFQCGHLLIAHSMPTYRTLNKDRALTLLYNSDLARVRPVIMADISLGSNVGVPDSLRIEVVINSNTWAFSYSSANLAPGGAKRRVALPVNAQGTLASGLQNYTVRAISFYTGSTPQIASQTGRLLILDRSTSKYGAGWSVAGLERLFHTPSCCAIGNGDGSVKIYNHVSGNRWVSAPGGERDTLNYAVTQDPGGSTEPYWVRRDLEGTESYFNAAGNLKWIEDRTGQKVHYKYLNDTVPGSPLHWVRIAPHAQYVDKRYTFSYDANGLSGIADPAGRVLAAVVAYGELIKLRDPGYSPGNGEVHFAYNDGLMTSWTSKRGFVTKYAYYANTALLKADTLPQTQPGRAVTNFTPVQARGLPTASHLSQTHATTTASLEINGPRDIADVTNIWVNRFGSPDSIQDAAGYRTIISRTDPQFPSFPTRIKYPNGRIVKIKYDANGQPTEIRDSTSGVTGGFTTTIVNSYTYNSPNTRTSPDSHTNPMTLTTMFSYDSVGLPQQVTLPGGHQATFVHGTGPLSGLLTSITENDLLVYELADPNDSTTGRRGTLPRDLTTIFGYDSLGNMISETSPSGLVRQFHRNGTTEVTNYYDAMNHRTEFTYDQLGRELTRVRHPLPSEPGYTTAPTRFFHNMELTDSVLDPRNVARHFSYDALGRTVAETDETGHTERRRYDLAGQLVSVLPRVHAGTAAADSIRYAYNERGLRTKLAWPARDGSARDSVLYTYDEMGRVKTATSANWKLTRDYYATGWLKKEVQSKPDGTLASTHEYGYDLAGRRTWYEIGNQATETDSIWYEYDPLSGDLEEIGVKWRNDSRDSVLFDFDGIGRRSALVYQPNATSEIEVEFAYDRDGRLRFMCSEQSGTTSVFKLRAVAESMDKDGLIHRFSKVNNSTTCASTHSGVQVNTYDSRHQLLTQVDGNDTNVYTYDDSGNMLTWKRPLYTQDKKFEILSGSNRLSRYWKNFAADPGYDIRIDYAEDGSREDERPYTNNSFDPNKLTRRMYAYDGLGRLTGTGHYEVGPTNSWGGEDGATEFNVNWVPLLNRCKYDPDGRQVVPCEDPAPRLGFDGNNVVRTGTDDASTAWTFVHGPGTDDPIIGYHPNAGTVYFLTDGQGRQYAVGAANGANKSTDPYYLSGGIFAGGISRAHTFLAERNAPTGNAGLSFFRNRFYDRATGRWTQEDPIGLAGGLNLFAYVGNNPASYTDPFGLCPEPENKNGTVCISLFISAASALGLKGDARGFSSSSDPAQSRVWLHVDPANKTFAAHANPSCTTGGRCAAALSSNQINVSFGANGGFTVSVNAKNSILPGPAINGTFSFQPNGRGGFTTSGNRDAFPSAEAYVWRNGEASTLFQRRETSPFSLFPFMRNDRW